MRRLAFYPAFILVIAGLDLGARYPVLDTAVAILVVLAFGALLVSMARRHG